MIDKTVKIELDEETRKAIETSINPEVERILKGLRE